MSDQLLEIVLATLRLATPLLFAAMGGLLSERSGVVNIALEGKMLVGAFFAAVVTLSTGSPWLGFAAGGLAGLCLAMVYGLAVLPLKANQIVAGTGINMLAAGIPPLSRRSFMTSLARRRVSNLATASAPFPAAGSRHPLASLVYPGQDPSWVCG